MLEEKSRRRYTVYHIRLPCSNLLQTMAGGGVCSRNFIRSIERLGVTVVAKIWIMLVLLEHVYWCMSLNNAEPLETSLICIRLSASCDVHFDKRMICFLSGPLLHLSDLGGFLWILRLFFVHFTTFVCAFLTVIFSNCLTIGYASLDTHTHTHTLHPPHTPPHTHTNRPCRFFAN